MLAYLQFGLQLIPLLVQVGEDIGPFVAKLLAVSNSGVIPADQDWKDLHDQEARLRAILDAPEDPKPAA